jgi:hypothetical protein
MRQVSVRLVYQCVCLPIFFISDGKACKLDRRESAREDSFIFLFCGQNLIKHINFKREYQRNMVNKKRRLFNYTHQHMHIYIYIYTYILFKKSKIYIKTFKTLLHISIIDHPQGACIFPCKSYNLKHSVIH